MKLISGLGNPTRKYRLTRHNVGFLAIDRIARSLSIRLKKKRHFSSLIGEGEFKGERIVLLEPLIFMNLSGEAVGSVAGKKKINAEDIMVICDDIDLGLGRIRIRASGGSGGHKGLESIINNLGTEKFCRLRIGIGTSDAMNEDLSEYVLEKFSKTELISVDKILDLVTEAIKVYLAEGVEAAMTKFNSIVVS